MRLVVLVIIIFILFAFIYLVMELMMPVISSIHYATVKVNNMTTMFTDANVSNPYPANTFGYNISSTLATYVDIIIIVILGIVAIYMAYSGKR